MTDRERSEHDHPELEQSIAELKRLVEKHRRRLADVGQAIQLQTDVSRSHDESIDDLRAGQSDFDRKLAALVNAQIRTEDKFAELAQAQAESDRKIAALAQAQAEAERRFAEAQAAIAESRVELDRKMAELAESQAHSDGKLDALIDVVRDILEGRRPGGGPVV